MPDVRYGWNREFRERVLALALKSNWYVRYGTQVIRPEYFELEEEQRVAESLVQFYSKYNRVPEQDELLSLHSSELAQQLIHRMRNGASGNPEFAEDQAVQFAREQAMKLAILESVDDINKGDLQAIIHRVEGAQKVGTDFTDIGLDLKHDTSWVYREQRDEKVPTGIYHLDVKLEGGLATGELGVVLAPTNAGKTMTLVNFGCGAAGPMGHCNVAHITMELSKSKVAKRYGARSAFYWVTRETNPDEYILEFKDAVKLRMPGNILIREFPTKSASVDDVNSYLEKLKLLGIKVGMLLVDYPGIMRHLGRGEGWELLADTFERLRGIAMKWEIPVWAAAQAGRSATNKELVNLDDFGESYKAAQTADVVLALCQTQAEKEANVARLFAAKIRDGDAGWMVRCHLDRDSHSIISNEIMTVGELLEERKRRKEEEK